eukprot:CAMPEP_0173377606 /NCGR_PEP_ID=MMETSP1356-20130122/866_1 /TAXON_ID=77927 ORGANISM="Hemiselmis virescens, Strain PCC157" /NCGR_SAMPLE_ID=MMETSP1356 /ASSEMBLY_ACC=CAM_ASM_000847 /LENGTH=54 /DNA_ID=CAMNT_0014330417 /DNA_START=25 /DNA_END=189 /DNA_ORIENTATION=-
MLGKTLTTKLMYTPTSIGANVPMAGTQALEETSRRHNAAALMARPGSYKMGMPL